MHTDLDRYEFKRCVIAVIVLFIICVTVFNHREEIMEIHNREVNKEENRRKACTEKTIGEITSYEVETEVSGFILVTSRTKRIIFYSYEVNNNTYKLSQEVYNPYKEGDKITIHYNPDNPESCYTECE